MEIMKIPKNINNTNNVSSKKIYDLTKTLDKNTQLFPNDPIFKQNKVCSIAEAGYDLHTVYFSNHAGTHIDFPSHIIESGKTSSDFLIQDLCGSAIIVECLDKCGKVDKELVTKQNLDDINFIFFKNAMYIEKDAAKIIIEKGIKVVGIDSLSVDNIEDNSLIIHKLLLEKDILIIENLQLNEISSCTGNVIIAPLKIPNIDGLPVRVIMWCN